MTEKNFTKRKGLAGRLWAAALSLALILALTPASAFADSRTPIAYVEGTTAESTTPVFGAAWKNPEFTVTAGAPTRFHTGSGGWQKKIDGSWETQYGSGTFTAGEWRYTTQIRVDGTAGTTHVLAAPLNVKVNGEDWLIGGNPAVYDTFSFDWVISPEYTVTVPPGTPLSFIDNPGFDIPASYEGQAIAQVSVTESAAGGTAPYSFSKTSGPSWISVSSDGKINGTPSATGTNEALVVRVTDQEGDTAEITIAVAETRMNPDDRIKITYVEGTTAESTTPVFGAAWKTPEFTVTAGAPARFGTGSGGWQKKIDGSWETQYGSGTFTAGEWRYTTQIRVDGTAGTTHMLAAPLNVKVNGEDWLIGGNPAVYDTVSFDWVISPEYAVFDPSMPMLTGTVSVAGAPVYGETLTASVTDSNNTGTPSYQWKRDGADISGAQASSYTLVAADIGCRISVLVKSSVQLGSIESEQTSAVSKANVTVTGLSHTPAIVYESTPISSIVLSGTKMPDAAGTLALNAGQTLSAGTKDYSWTFTPADSAVYNSASGTISITVTADAVVSLSAGGTPSKTVYEWGEAFETAGLTVTASYASGAAKDVTSLVSAGTLEVGDTTVTLSYGGKSCTVGGITVNKKAVDISGVSWDVAGSPFGYDGTEKSVALTGVPAGVNAVKTGDKATDAGSYTASATLSPDDSAHYQLSSSVPVTASWSISPAATAGSDLTRNIKAGTTADQSVNASDFGLAPSAGSFALNGSITDASAALDGSPVCGTSVGFKLKPSAAAGNTVTVPLRFTPADTNYAAKDVTLTISIIAKDVPSVTVNPISVTYSGSPVPESAITGAASFGGNPVSGTFAWKGSPAVTNVADSGNKTVTFTPADSANYESVDVNLTLTISRADCTGAPAYTAISASGKTLADAALSAGTLAPAGGSVSWDDSLSTEVIRGTAYGWTYTPADTANYNSRTGSIIPWPVSGGGGGGGSAPGYAVNAQSAGHGSVSVGPSSAAAGDTVTVSVSPDEGYELDQLSVTGADGKEIKLAEQGGKFTFVMPSGRIEIRASFVPAGMAVAFADVNAGDWFYEPVKWALRNGITAGTSETSFSPGAPCTRAQMVTFLWRAAGMPEPVSAADPFSDVDESAYYYRALLWAHEQGIITGTGAGHFSPGVHCTRAQMAVILYRFADSPAASAASPFTDVEAGAYYSAAAAWAAENGISTGTGAGHFSPEADCTRAQIVSFLYRYMTK